MRYVRTFDGTFNEANKYSYDGIFKSKIKSNQIFIFDIKHTNSID